MLFKRFFYLSLAAISLIGVVYAGLALAVIAEAYKRVEIGRLASDALVAFQSAQVAAATLERYVAVDGAQLTGSETVTHFRGAVGASLATAAGIHADLAARGRAGLYATALLRDRMLAETWAEIDAALSANPATASAEEARRASLVPLLGRFSVAIEETVVSERTLLAQKRIAADRSLELLGYLAYAAALLFILASLVAGFLLKRRLDPPLTSLERGLESIRSGDFSTHAPIIRDDEFGRLAEILNFAATMLDESRRRDLSARQVLEQTVEERTSELSRAIHDMQALANQRSKLLSDLGHELRTPLTIIRGEAEVALRTDRFTKAEYKQILSIIQTASIQLMGLLDDLTTISGEGDPTLRVSLAVHAPDQIVRATLPLLAKTRRGIEVDLRVPDARCLLDPLRLQQAILVLLENAIAYSPDDTKTTVRSAAAHGFWCLDGIDRGIGIREEEIGSIFNRGYRSELAKARRPAGLGYGLGIAATLVERQGGSLSAASAGGDKGSTFSIRLPLVQEE